MLHIRNASQFRNYYKTVVARDRDNDLEIDFVSTLHPNKERFEKGFARLIYANREDIGGFLRSSALNVAADQQALYELIQNADDSDSTFFSVSYNEDYLLCINNGNYFTDSNMSAIINVGDSDKHGEDIGTFGIGFKILHRLLGEDDGLDAIINDYAGPIIFSWNKFSQLEKLLNGDDIRTGGFDKEANSYSYELDKSNPWLVKIIYTCFSTHLYEKIRLKDYETQKVAFKTSDLYEMRVFLQKLAQQTKLVENEKRNLNKGSIFFLKLGK